MTRTLTVPVRCDHGHELTARTTYVDTKAGRPSGWECVRCVRVDVYRAHHGRRAELPADLLDEDRFTRQPWVRSLGGVVFASGWGYDDPDPTPELRAERDRARYGACARGHLFTPENAYVDATGRTHCRACRALNQRRRRAGEPKPPDPRRQMDSRRIAVA